MLKIIKWTIIIFMILMVILAIRIDMTTDVVGDELEFTIEMDDYSLSGTLYKPEDLEVYPVVVFLHGDGAADRTSNGHYTTVMNAFLKKGIGCFSYDKPGVGKSTGNWLNQTMTSRAEESKIVMDFLREVEAVSHVGVIGFSQGGWVVSELALLDVQVDYMIVYSGAIDWMAQGQYMEDIRLKNSGMSKNEIVRYQVYSNAVDESLRNNDYEAYLSIVNNYGHDVEMTKDRFYFVHQNMDSNAEEGIYQMTEPFLGVFGLEDENVDAQHSAHTYERVFKEINKENYRIRVYDDGNHSLLKSRYSELTWIKYMEIMILGDRCYVDGLLDELGDFVLRAIE